MIQRPPEYWFRKLQLWMKLHPTEKNLWIGQAPIDKFTPCKFCSHLKIEMMENNNNYNNPIEHYNCTWSENDNRLLVTRFLNKVYILGNLKGMEIDEDLYCIEWIKNV